MIIFFTLLWLITMPIFIVYWWKKRKARIAAGENYKNDENYNIVSRRKRLVGLICIASFLSVLILLPSVILEEKARWAEELKAERAREIEASQRDKLTENPAEQSVFK